MILHGVECTRTEPIVPEAYVCRWQDRNDLALGLLKEGKGSITKDRPGNPDVKGLLSKRHAVVVVESYSE